VSQKNVEIAREVFEHLNRRDWAAILAATDEEAVLVVHESAAPDPGTFRGREAVGQWFGEWFLAFGKDYRFEVEEARSIGDRVLTVARHHGHGRSSGAEVQYVNAHLFSVNAGKVVRLELYGSRAEALEALRLAE
jgi:ketosteroid isomerase-like protein